MTGLASASVSLMSLTGTVEIPHGIAAAPREQGELDERPHSRHGDDDEHNLERVHGTSRYRFAA